MEDGKITLNIDGENISFSIVEDFKLNGQKYLLVTESNAKTEEAPEDDAYILKEVRNEAGDIIYEFLEDDNELAIISDYLNSVLEDFDIEY